MRIAFKLLILLLAMTLFIIKNNGFGNPSTMPAEESPLVSDISFFEGRYIDAFNGYSLKQPGEDWKFTPTPRSKNLIKLDMVHKSGKFGLQVRVYEKGDQYFSEFAATYIARFRSEMQNPEILNDSEFDGNGITGRAIAFDGRERNEFYLKSYLFEGQKFFYVLQGGCPFKQVEQLEPELDKIATSFKLQ
ncbi:MAG: hypothetical protein ACOYXC_04115 [Candidatus Rifleibacteriota bacterium]